MLPSLSRLAIGSPGDSKPLPFADATAPPFAYVIEQELAKLDLAALNESDFSRYFVPEPYKAMRFAYEAMRERWSPNAPHTATALALMVRQLLLGAIAGAFRNSTETFYLELQSMVPLLRGGIQVTDEIDGLLLLLNVYGFKLFNLTTGRTVQDRVSASQVYAVVNAPGGAELRARLLTDSEPLDGAPTSLAGFVRWLYNLTFNVRTKPGKQFNTGRFANALFGYAAQSTLERRGDGAVFERRLASGSIEKPIVVGATQSLPSPRRRAICK